MPISKDRIDEAVLALLWLGRHNDYRTWKGFDWDAMNRLHVSLLAQKIPPRGTRESRRLAGWRGKPSPLAAELMKRRRGSDSVSAAYATRIAN